MEVKDMTEEQWKATSKGMINELVGHEKMIREAIGELLPPLQVPSAALTVNDKLDELHETFSHDGIPLQHHLIVSI